MHIHLDSPNRGYLPGALVQGELELSPSDDGEQGSLTIVFTGRSIIEIKAGSIGPGDYGTNTQFLVRSKQVLYEGATPFTSMPPGGWPFLFTFPSKPHSGMKQEIWTNAPMKHGQPKKWSCDEAFDSLPQSFHFSGGPISSADVEYRLDAKWVSASQHKKDSAMLSFDTYRWDPDPALSPVTDAQRLLLKSPLLPRQEPGTCPLTFKDKFHMAFGPEGMMTRAEFTLHTKVGTRIVQGAVPTIELSLVYVPQKSTAADIPAVVLRSFMVIIEQVTAVRTLRRAAFHTTAWTLGAKDSLDIPLRSDEAVDVSEVLGLRTEDVPYDLSTFNIQQRHQFLLSFDVECMQKRFTFRQKLGLDMLSPFYEETPPGFDA